MYIVFLALAPGRLFAGDASAFTESIRPLLDQYCYDCHGPAKPKGGVNLEQFENEAAVYRDPKLWQTVLTQLHERNMPPENKLQPADHERDRLADWIKQTLDKLDHGTLPKDPGRVLIHRLSRLEYNNTVRDLFGVTIKPADKFPADGGGGGGFDNIADTLFVPPILMERFLAAADEVLEVARPESLFVARPSWFRSERTAARMILSYFAPRAFRRPVGMSELAQLLGLFESAQARGKSFENSVKLALKAILVSPKFLFRIELDRPIDAPYPVSDFELASRLSYFLWSTMPDEELFLLAKQKRLIRPEVVENQVKRMLRDPKSRTLAENFAGQWLRINELTTTAQPDPQRFPGFTIDLRDAMMEEPLALFGSILRENASVLDLLDADYTFVNEKLARHYGLENVNGDELRKVQLNDRVRGGVLGMAGILTLTSYPLRTSPVLRGKWVLEEILGTPPPPPPPMVKSLPRDDKPQDGLTLRQQLEKHRSDAACANCHKRMDPLGLGLENFDAIGRWRTEISGQPVDASGVMATGEPFSGPAELKQILFKRRGDFVRNLTEKMLSYALGRGLDYYDTPVVNQITRAVAENSYRSSTLVTEIVKSYPFQFRRNQPMTAVANRQSPAGTARTDSDRSLASTIQEQLQ